VLFSASRYVLWTPKPCGIPIARPKPPRPRPNSRRRQPEAARSHPSAGPNRPNGSCSSRSGSFSSFGCGEGVCLGCVPATELCGETRGFKPSALRQGRDFRRHLPNPVVLEAARTVALRIQPCVKRDSRRIGPGCCGPCVVKVEAGSAELVQKRRQLVRGSVDAQPIRPQLVNQDEDDARPLTARARSRAPGGDEGGNTRPSGHWMCPDCRSPSDCHCNTSGLLRAFSSLRPTDTAFLRPRAWVGSPFRERRHAPHTDAGGIAVSDECDRRALMDLG